MHEDFTTPVGAAAYLMDQAKQDGDLRGALAAICSRRGCRDLPEFASKHPEEIMEIAVDFRDMAAQTPPGLDRL